MTQNQDIRWQQRFSNYRKALRQLGDAVELRRQRPLSDLEKQGLIQSFEYTYELGWNTLKDYLTFQGITDMTGARDVIRQSFRRELLSDGEGWMAMLADRNLTSHTYNEDTATEIVQRICDRYYDILLALQGHMSPLETRQ
jgi:nucleotidyltransferase substrate binding protein (TIGR01987 family)